MRGEYARVLAMRADAEGLQEIRRQLDDMLPHQPRVEKITRRSRKDYEEKWQ